MNQNQNYDINQATLSDLKLSLVITSLTANAYILVGWMVLELSGYQLVASL